MKNEISDKEYNDEIIVRIKNLIISQGDISYIERKAFESFLQKMNNDYSFGQASASLVRKIEKIQENPDIKISKEGEEIYEKITSRYSIVSQIYWNPNGQRMNDKSWFIFTIFLIIFSWLLMTGKLNFILSLLNKL